MPIYDSSFWSTQILALTPSVCQSPDDPQHGPYLMKALGLASTGLPEGPADFVLLTRREILLVNCFHINSTQISEIIHLRPMSENKADYKLKRDYKGGLRSLWLGPVAAEAMVGLT